MYSQLNYILYRRMVVDDNYHAAIVHCIVGNRITPLRIFLDAGAKLGNRAARDYYAANIHTCKKNAGFIREHPLVAAASLGRVEIVRMLLERAEDVNAQNLAFFREMMNEYSALLMAITEGQVEVVQILVDAGIDLRGYSSGGKPSNIPLVRAAIHKNLDMVKIIAGKLRAERKTYRIQTYNSQCGHALRAAIAADSHQIVEYFLHDGLDPNSSRTSESFLYTAVTATPPSYDRGVMVELLLAYGASTGTSDPGLIEACWARNFGVVKHVLRAGCRWRYRVREVRWARLLAESEGQLVVFIQYFEKPLAGCT
jgi:ankyrin repeat protein